MASNPLGGITMVLARFFGTSNDNSAGHQVGFIGNINIIYHPRRITDKTGITNHTIPAKSASTRNIVMITHD